MAKARLNTLLTMAMVMGVVATVIWFYRPHTGGMSSATGPQSQEELQQIQGCLSQIPSYDFYFLGDQQPVQIHPEQMMVGPFVALSTMNTDFYTGVVTTSLELNTEETDMWIGRLGGEDSVGAVVVGEDGDGYECVSFQEAAIGSAVTQFGSGDMMIWDSRGNAYFKLNGTTVVPIGSAAYELIQSSASLSELQEVMMQRPKEGSSYP